MIVKFQHTLELTPRQVYALKAGLRNDGAVWYGCGNRMGGAYSRMCMQMAKMGLVDSRGPHQLTDFGFDVATLIVGKENAKKLKKS